MTTPHAGPALYLEKDSNDLVCYCECDEAPVAFPGQADCPWCGCGWLFSCMKCRKAFSFARGVHNDRSWDELARRDMSNGGWTINDDSVAAWVEDMQGLLVGIEAGRRYVFLDGAYLPADAGTIQFEGWYAQHDLALAPQSAALDNPNVIEEILSNPRYWRDNERPDRRSGRSS